MDKREDGVSAGNGYAWSPSVPPRALTPRLRTTRWSVTRDIVRRLPCAAPPVQQMRVGRGVAMPAAQLRRDAPGATSRWRDPSRAWSRRVDSARSLPSPQ
jgi:hypothetical protein